MKQYYKIVRDRIPEIIENSGKHAEWEIVSREEALEGLEQKLLEEVKEYLDGRNMEELSDVLEVIHALAQMREVPFEEIERMRLRKKEERGGFEKGIRLLKVYQCNDTE